MLTYREPKGPGIRVDSGIGEGSEVTVRFDPLLAKVIASAETRESCIDRLCLALRDYVILGTKTNLQFLRRTIEHPAFRALLSRVVAGLIRFRTLHVPAAPLYVR